MDYYIRSWDPDSTYPANPQEGDVCYTITLDQSWAPVAGVKNDNLLKEEVYQNGEWVEQGGGGGGGGDFTTAIVTIVNNSGAEWDMAIPQTLIMDGVKYVVPTYTVEDGGEVEIVLYKNGGALVIPSNSPGTVYSVSGDAEDIGGAIIVTGACTITFADE